MSLSSHLDELKKKHENLKQEVQELQKSPGFDELELAALKKEKLRIKEEIYRLSS